MRPDRCGFGRRLDHLTPGDRTAVEDFGAFLAGRIALTADERSWVPFSDPRAAIRVCGCRWEPAGERRGVQWTTRCDEHAEMCRAVEAWEHEILDGVA